MTVPPSRLTAALADRYRLERELGAGGMATVYLARDLKHEREVAIKVLRPELAAVIGAERFLVEIRTTANLQHPHILPLFDSGAADSFLFYVMPLVKGISLRDRMSREKQLPIGEATRIASEVAAALDYAHRHGVIHRDIKPENILLHDGSALVADFGIALAASKAGGRMTQTGMSLGTPQYMSPEQAMGERELDARSDVYALGCVLYEMLTGEPPFSGPTAQAIVAKVMTAEPAEVTSLRKTIPSHVADAVHTALQKLPADRFESAAAFAAALADRQFATALRSGGHVAPRAGRAWHRDPRSWAAMLVAVAMGAFAFNARSSSPAYAELVTLRVSVPGPDDSTLFSLPARPGPTIAEPVVSPDGRYLAFSADRAAGMALYVRALDAFELTEIPGGGHWPFFSPDGTSLAFIRERELWTMSLPGGVPARAAMLLDGGWDLTSAVWHPDGHILMTALRGVWEVPARGGEPRLLAARDSSSGERFDEIGVLPDGRLLLGVTTSLVANTNARVVSRTEVLARDGTTRTPVAAGLEAVQVVDDIMLFTQGGQRRASRYDTKTLTPLGEPIPLADLPTPRAGRSIAWVEGTTSRSLEPVWVTREGVVTPLGIPGDSYRWPRVAPNGRRLAIGTGSTRRTDLAVFDLGRGTTTRIAGSTEPTWSPDGRRLFVSSGNSPYGGLLVQPSDGSRTPDTLFRAPLGDVWPTDVSRDERWLAAYGASLGTGADPTDAGDLMIVELTTRAVQRVRLPGGQRGGRFSPDGRWLAYESSESGSLQVHVRPWPDMDANIIVSRGSGTEPAWSRDGTELFYRSEDQVLAVAAAVREGGFEPSSPRVLFSGIFKRDAWGDQSYDVAPDGRFLMLRPIPGERIELRIVLNWIADVRARLDARP